MAFAADGHTMATVSTDNTVLLWDLTDPTRPHQLRSSAGGPWPPASAPRCHTPAAPHGVRHRVCTPGTAGDAENQWCAAGLFHNLFIKLPPGSGPSRRVVGCRASPADGDGGDRDYRGRGRAVEAGEARFAGSSCCWGTRLSDLCWLADYWPGLTMIFVVYVLAGLVTSIV
jgi:hypothetical protein